MDGKGRGDGDEFLDPGGLRGRASACGLAAGPEVLETMALHDRRGLPSDPYGVGDGLSDLVVGWLGLADLSQVVIGAGFAAGRDRCSDCDQLLLHDRERHLRRLPWLGFETPWSCLHPVGRFSVAKRYGPRPAVGHRHECMA
jgi:hypothetical protein